MNVGFVGLGQMGRPMAERLKGAGHSLKVYNRTRSSSETVSKPEEVPGAEIVITMLAGDAAVRAVWLDSSLARRLPKGAIHLNMATVSMGIARQLTEIHGALRIGARIRPAAACGAGAARHHRRRAEGCAREVQAGLFRIEELTLHLVEQVREGLAQLMPQTPAPRKPGTTRMRKAVALQ